MVDANSRAGQQAVERAAKAAQTDNLGPGTAGYTTSGAAYQGQNVADARGLAGPAEPGFGPRGGLGYTDGVTPPPDYPPTEATPGAAGTAGVTAATGLPSELAGPPVDFVGPPYHAGQIQAGQNQTGGPG